MTVPTMPLPAPTGAATPADSGNPNNPVNLSPGAVSSGAWTQDSSTGLYTGAVSVNGKLIGMTLNSQLNPNSIVGINSVLGITGSGKQSGTPFVNQPKGTQTVEQELNSISTWYGNADKKQQYVNEMYAAGLITSKKSPTAAEVSLAWQLAVQEAALQTSAGNATLSTPDQVLSAAAQNGWNALPTKQQVGDVDQLPGTGNPNNSQDAVNQSNTTYTSYMDPATVMGTLADSYFRLMGRNPTSAEYQSFLNNVFSYQQAANTGTLKESQSGSNVEQATIDPNTGLPVDQSGQTSGSSTTTNEVSQRGIATRGVQFLAGQQALASPEEGTYQAATTYFNAFVKALSGPASGMQASGPTTTTP